MRSMIPLYYDNLSSHSKIELVFQISEAGKKCKYFYYNKIDSKLKADTQGFLNHISMLGAPVSF